MSNEVTQFVDGALRAAPPITVSAASVFGLGLEDWMYIATIVYTVLQGSWAFNGQGFFGYFKGLVSHT